MFRNIVARYYDISGSHMPEKWHFAIPRPRPRENQNRSYRVVETFPTEQATSVELISKWDMPGQWPKSPTVTPINTTPNAHPVAEQESAPTAELAGQKKEHEEEKDCPAVWQLPAKSQKSMILRISSVKNNKSLQESLPPQPHRTSTGGQISSERLPIIPERRYWPSWYRLEQKRRETGLDYPTSDDDAEATARDQLSSIHVRLSRRGEQHLQAQLQHAVREAADLRDQIQYYEQQASVTDSQLKTLQEANEQHFRSLRSYFDQAVEQNQAEIKQQKQRFEAANRSHHLEVDTLQQRLKSAQQKYEVDLQNRVTSHQRALEEQKISHKNQLDSFVEDQVALNEDIEKEYEQELADKDTQIKSLQAEVDKLKIGTTPSTDTGSERVEEISKLTNILVALQTRYEDQLTQTHAASADAEAAKMETKNLQKEKLIVSEENRNLNDKILQLLVKPQELKRSLGECNKQLEELVDQCKSSQIMLEEGQIKLNQVTNERDQLRDTVQNIEEEHSNARIQYEADIALLAEKVDELNSQSLQPTAKSDQEASVPHTCLLQEAEQTEQLRKLQSQVELLNNERQEAVEYAIRLKTEHGQMQAENFNLKAQGVRFEQALNKREAEVSQLQAALEDFDLFRDHTREREGLLNSMDEVQTENKKLREQVSHWKGRYHADMNDLQRLRKENAILITRRPHLDFPGGGTTAEGDEQNQLRQLAQQYEARLKRERLERGKAESNANRYQKMTADRDKEIYKLRRLDIMSKEKLLDQATQDVTQAKTETETARATARQESIRAEEASLRADLAEAEHKRTKENMQEHMEVTNLQITADILHNERMQAQKREIAWAKRQVADAEAQHQLSQQQNPHIMTEAVPNAAKRKQDDDSDEVASDQYGTLEMQATKRGRT